MTMTDTDDLGEADRAALQLALDLTLADDPPDESRVEQVTDFLREPMVRGCELLRLSPANGTTQPETVAKTAVLDRH